MAPPLGYRWEYRIALSDSRDLRLLRGLGLSVGLAAGAAGLAACGGSNPSTNSVNRPAGSTPLVRRAAAYARAVNLREGDVEGLTAVTPEHELAPGSTANRVSRCAGISISGKNVFVSARLEGPRSPTSSVPLEVRRPVAVFSEIVVTPSKALAQQQVAIDDHHRVAQCFAEAAGLVSSTQPLKTTKAAIERVPAALRRAGASGFRVRTVTTLRSANPSVAAATHTAYADFLSFAQGTAVIELDAFHIGPPSVSKIETTLLALLKERATKYSP